MSSETHTLPDDIGGLKEIIASKSDTINFYQSRIDALEEKVRNLKSKLFGRKSEKHISEEDDKQQMLFDEPEEIEEQASAEEKIEVPAHTRRKRGRKPLPADLPRIEIVHDLTEEEKICGCGCKMVTIGKEVSEKLDIIPAKIQVIRNIRPKYACKNCEGVESDKTVKIAPVPAQMIPKGIATAGLLAHVTVSKFVDALPLYRQEKMFSRIGVDLSRATMANWLIKVGEQCRPLIDLCEQEIRSGPLINIDETTVQVLKEPGRSNTSKSYMWVFRGGDPDKPALIYQYHPTRSGQVARDFLADYQGYVQTDAYPGYNGLERMEGIVLVGCWAHARRKFVEVINARKNNKNTKIGSAEVALSYIRKLYAIEKRAQIDELSDTERYDLRQKEAIPIFDQFKPWLDKKINQTPPKGLLGMAVRYTLDQWQRLIRYAEDGRITPDNNLAENAIRPFVVGRKNWLFSGHPRGAEASATIFTLIETAKANKLEPYIYLRYVFGRLPHAGKPEDYRKLLPQNLSIEKIVAAVGDAVK